mmetsp:Transcript_25913/g.48844  ORF Transcript_25913/g.48844 Transcript_25913/m.48844 type:complete len:274 (+) Transcript_25913:5298-6119(+)
MANLGSRTVVRRRDQQFFADLPVTLLDDVPYGGINVDCSRNVRVLPRDGRILEDKRVGTRGGILAQNCAQHPRLSVHFQRSVQIDPLAAADEGLSQLHFLLLARKLWRFLALLSVNIGISVNPYRKLRSHVRVRAVSDEEGAALEVKFENIEIYLDGVVREHRERTTDRERVQDARAHIQINSPFLDDDDVGIFSHQPRDVPCRFSSDIPALVVAPQKCASIAAIGVELGTRAALFRAIVRIKYERGISGDDVGRNTHIARVVSLVDCVVSEI